MASDDSSSSHPTEKKEEAATAAAGGAGFDDLEDPRFQCCVCLELLYKPVVIGKVLLFMMIKNQCGVFLNIIWLLLVQHVVICHVSEQERSVDTFSPQIIEFLNSKNNNGENGKDWGNKLEDGKTGPPGEVSVDDSTMNEHSMKIKLDDVSCPICKELLYQPTVLNCGHVYCISCLPSVGDEALKCQVCGGLHPGDFPNVCLDLDHFLEEYFPAEYESRRKKLQLENSQCNPEGSSSSTSCKKGAFVQKTLDLSNVHIGVGCDSCGVYPIRGKRYKCKDCTEAIGFDLCGECYDSTSKLPGRFNQQHTPDHRMELDNSSLFDAFLRFQGIPAEGLQQLVQQMELIGAGGMVQLVADDEEMEDNHEDA
uniref:Uncharacterized protein n=1 Tax=Aegilops tauschii TaxID=37682 RepID=R7WF72_AEGTA